MGFVILSAGALVPVWPSITVQFPAVDNIRPMAERSTRARRMKKSTQTGDDPIGGAQLTMFRSS
jgi:hypothetical protein